MKGVPSLRTIQSPDDLALLIREIKDAVAAGILQQVRPELSPFATDVEILDLAEWGPWPDYIEMRFRVTGTMVCYKLEAETYHGTGGTWAPE